MSRLRKPSWRYGGDVIAHVDLCIATLLEIIELSVEEQAARCEKIERLGILDSEECYLMMLTSKEYMAKHGDNHWWSYSCYGIVYDAYAMLHCPVLEVKEFSAWSRGAYYEWWHRVGKYDVDKIRATSLHKQD